jgi:hypothetical protein
MRNGQAKSAHVMEKSTRHLSINDRGELDFEEKDDPGYRDHRDCSTLSLTTLPAPG